MFGFKYKPSKKQIREFIAKMNQIEEFCKEHGIARSFNSDSYYFIANGKAYRVSNSLHARGEYVYDPISDHGIDTDDSHTTYIYASKTRIIDIYNDIIAGYELDGHGRRKEQVNANQ